jgi:hypothetical protein
MPRPIGGQTTLITAATTMTAKAVNARRFGHRWFRIFLPWVRLRQNDRRVSRRAIRALDGDLSVRSECERRQFRPRN